jgi:hypothetical protein
MSSEGKLTNDIALLNQYTMIIFVAILAFFFQFKGMTIMKENLAHDRGLTSGFNDEWDGQTPNPNSGFKKKIASLYQSDKYYTDEEDSVFWTPSRYSPVRIIYNTLVGMNQALFYCMGGTSDDPSHEIAHWAKILLYWEVLSRLIKRHGLGPTHLATQLILQTWMQSSKHDEIHP